MKNANEMNQNLRVIKTNFNMKGFVLELALKQRRKETRKSPVLRGPDKQAVGENWTCQQPIRVRDFSGSLGDPR